MFAGGLWEVAIDKDTGQVNITTLRSAEGALNVLGLIEPEELFLLNINIPPSTFDPEIGHIGANITLRHPLHSPGGIFKGC